MREPRTIIATPASIAQPPKPFASTATIETVAGLTPRKTYTFKIAATNARGTGPQSAQTNAVTPA